MEWWTFWGADASVTSTWFGLRHARLKVVVLQPTVVSRFGCFLDRIRDLGASLSSFGCFVFEFWVFRFSRSGCFAFEICVLRASVFVFETTAENRMHAVSRGLSKISPWNFIINKLSKLRSHLLYIASRNNAQILQKYTSTLRIVWTRRCCFYHESKMGMTPQRLLCTLKGSGSGSIRSTLSYVLIQESSLMWVL